MKISELINQLKELDPNMDVCVPDGSGYYDPAMITVESMSRLENSNTYYSECTDKENAILVLIIE